MGLHQNSVQRPSLTRIYKILTRQAWEEALIAGIYRGSEVDHADGFIHFSTAEQAQETARRHFAGQRDLVVLALDGSALGEALRWEPSRGGALFPHLYAYLPVKLVLEARAASLGADGVPELSELDP